MPPGRHGQTFGPGLAERNLFDDFNPEALQSGHVSESVGEKTDLPNAQIRKYLSAQTHLTKGTSSAIFGADVVFAGALVADQEDTGWHHRTIDAEAAGSIMEIKKGATAGASDDAQRIVNHGAGVWNVV